MLPTGEINRETDALGVENLDIGEENAEPSRISMLIPNLSNQHSCRVSKTNNRTLHQQNSKTKKLSSLKLTEVKYIPDSSDGDQGKFFVENEIEALKQFDYEKDLYEFEQFQKPVMVKGRLKQNLEYWEDVGASDFIISTINEGYKMLFIDSLEPAEFKNNRSAIHNSEFVSNSLRELIASKRVVEAPFKPTVVNPLSVSSDKGKKRLILDLRYVNLHIWKDRVKFENWKVFSNYLTKDSYIFKFDLKSGCHHLDIYLPHQTYLGFSWVIDGQKRYFCFTVLPFVLSSIPYIFTKLLRPLVKFWRYHGLLIVIILMAEYVF